ncbi:filamentous hemagglutinin family outer membrane protein [Calothrix parasitica NIES-267]|uniref:Filamentous hemagglutinin family outer membrane protein n=1 Tax=Calothrix parasitica NIES-267 TaxID=1973488 RepID=A0A1Z4LMU3_9CYAN|nr:filamentous hemagglutinin family outer membrane protein [Calothrix parasitica NIES-267]
MKETVILSGFISVLVTSGMLIPAMAQVTSDGTTNTQVNINGNNFNILNGIQRGGNLFHSFEEFSIPTRGAAIFRNSTDVVNIINRVTGGNISSVDGLIKANGNANLFLINPAGIMFGENARLNIGGSFLGSTAESILFEDAFEFSAVKNAQSESLLSVSVPLGLQMGQNPGAIAVRSNTPLRTTPGQTLALVGGDVTFTKGRINAPSAHVELGSVSNGIVGISPTWQFDYAASQPSHSVNLTQGSQIVTKGANGGGNVRIFGENLFVTTGSTIDTSSISSQAGGNINVQTKKEILIDQRDGTRGTGLLAEVKSNASGQGRNITLQTQNLRMLNGGFLSVNTSGNANAGNLNITADTILVDTGTSNVAALLRANVNPTAQGNGGEINIKTNQLQLLNGAQVVANTNGIGNGGKINVIANDIKVDGVKNNITSNGTINTIGGGFLARGDIKATGNAGDITLQTEQLKLLNGGRIITTSEGRGNAGNASITAGSVVLDSGTSRMQSVIKSTITQNSGGSNGGNIRIQADSVRLLNGSNINVSTSAKGKAGSITIVANDVELAGKNVSGQFSSAILGRINVFGIGEGADINLEVGRLRILDGARINVGTEGIGDAGNLNITAQVVEIDQQTSTRATGLFSEVVGSRSSLRPSKGGELKLRTQSLSLANGGKISALTAGNGDAGNINITADQTLLQTGSTISNETFGAWNAGNLNLFTRKLDLDNRSTITSASYGLGSAGNLNLQAQDTTLLNASQITTRSASTGDGGIVKLTGDSLILRNGSSINASTASENGGNINLNLQSDLILRNNSFISTEAKGKGNGGNITVNSPVIAGLENSDIIANAFEGNGGNINITTQGIFGLEFRNELTEESDITASSQFGVSGTLEINNLSIDTSSGLVELPVALTDSSQQIAEGCSSNTGSSFVATGKGGIPNNPSQNLNINRTWSDIRDLSTYRQGTSDSEVVEISNKPAIIEASGFIRNENGEVELVALENTPFTTKKVAKCSSTNT